MSCKSYTDIVLRNLITMTDKSSVARSHDQSMLGLFHITRECGGLLLHGRLIACCSSISPSGIASKHSCFFEIYPLMGMYPVFGVRARPKHSKNADRRERTAEAGVTILTGILRTEKFSPQLVPLSKTNVRLRKVFRKTREYSRNLSYES